MGTHKSGEDISRHPILKHSLSKAKLLHFQKVQLLAASIHSLRVSPNGDAFVILKVHCLLFSAFGIGRATLHHCLNHKPPLRMRPGRWTRRCNAKSWTKSLLSASARRLSCSRQERCVKPVQLCHHWILLLTPSHLPNPGEGLCLLNAASALLPVRHSGQRSAGRFGER